MLKRKDRDDRQLKAETQIGFTTEAQRTQSPDSLK
jgi:hypothetical protein